MTKDNLFRYQILPIIIARIAKVIFKSTTQSLTKLATLVVLKVNKVVKVHFNEAVRPSFWGRDLK